MPTRYPIVLVHGFAMKDTFFMKSFGQIDSFLRAQGFAVYKSGVDAVGSVESNAEQLRAEVEAILRETGAEKVNLIAHSKGGLDAKQMILRFGMAERVASLTTLCTPHRGTPVASFVLKLPPFALRFLAFWINGFFRILGDKRPDSFAACQDLKRTERQAEEAARPIGSVFCQSFSATLQPGEKTADFMIRLPMIFSRWMEKGRATDGMVPRDSAIFGVYRGDCVDGSLSHNEVVDFMARGKKRDKIFAFYAALCEELAQAGL